MTKNHNVYFCYNLCLFCFNFIGSPAKRPSLFCRSSHSSPEHRQKAPALSVNKTKDLKSSLDRDDVDMATSDSYLQISKTKELPHDQV
jgi:hypothetical protein